MKEEGKSGLLFKLIQASAGTYRQFQVAFWAQIILGFLYSFGYFDVKIAGFVLGFVMPVLWITLTYRYVLIKARENVRLPFPKWMQKNPGNTLVIVIDILFLALIWTIVLSGLYEAIWVKVIFTMVFPVLTLSMLRNLVIYPFPDKEKSDEGHTDDISEKENENQDKE